METGDTDDVPCLVSSSDNESDYGEPQKGKQDDFWNDEDDGDEEMMSMLHGDVTCLFCSKVEISVEDVISHCKTSHHFDIPSVCQRWSVDCIAYIKLINFCRKDHPHPDRVIQALMAGNPEWEGDEYMQAIDPTDLMLQLDIESVMTSLSITNTKDTSPNAYCVPTNITTAQDSNNHHSSSSSLSPSSLSSSSSSSSSTQAVVALTARVKAAEEERDLLRGEMNRVLQDMEKLKLSGQQLVMNLSGNGKEESSSSTKKTDKVSDEDGYFASYSHHGIHMTMLKDEVRTKSYRDFMLCNKKLFDGKKVLDVGCGTGILSMFAVRAGAQHVVAVDSSQIIYQAMDIARENNMHDKITFVRGRLEDVTLPIKEFDVIVSEWMGYFLLFEAMLDSIVYARDRYLSPTGCVYPDRFTMKVVGVSDPDLYQQTVGYWDDVYGFKMSCMKGPILDEVQVCTVRGDNVVTEPAVIKEINVPTCIVSELDFESEFSLACQMDAKLTAIVGYFDTYFMHNCQQKIHFSTGPKSVKTHWEQAVMILPNPLPVKKGSSVPCRLSYKKHPHDSRGVVIHLTVDDLKLKYSLS